MARKLVKKILDVCHIPMWLFILLIVVLVLRIPSLFEPYSYGDEMIYLTLGQAVRERIPLYSGIHDNKPPLLYITAAIAGNLFWFKAILAIWHLLTVFVFWKFIDTIFKTKDKKKKVSHQRITIVSTTVFALLTTLPLFEGNIANSELFMLGPTILAFYILLSKKINAKNLLLAGGLFSVSTLFKMPAAFDVPAIVLYWIFTRKINLKNIKTIIKNTLILSIGFALPILVTIVYYWVRGAFHEYLVAAFLQNIGYLSTWRPDDVKEPFLVKNAPLIKRGLVVAFGSLALFVSRKKLSKQYLFAGGWLLLTLFAATLSERPYPHYLVQAVPPLAIFVGMLFSSITIEQILSILPITLFVFVPVYFHFWRYPTLPYYQKFIKFATRQIDQEEYFSTFGGETVRNYEVAKFLKQNTKRGEKVFVWGNSSTIYALSRRLPPIRYVADYHIKDFSSEEETVTKLKLNLPEYIVILPDSPSFTKLNELVADDYIYVAEIKGAKVWNLLKLQSATFH